MRLLFSLFAFAISLAGLLQSGWEVALSRALEHVKQDSSFTSVEDNKAFLKKSLDEEISELYSGWAGMARYAALSPEVDYSFGRASLLLSLLTVNRSEKLSLYCQALAAFKSAAAHSPNNPRYHIALADVEGQFRGASDYFCPEQPSKSTLSPAERLRHAQALAPYSTVDLYLAAVVYLGLNMKDDALRLLRLNQEINPSFTEDQRRYAYRLVSSQNDLHVALPRRYPEVLLWIAFFSRERESDYLLWRETFEQALMEAVTELQGRFRRGELGEEAYSRFLKSISALPLVASSTLLQRELDMIQADVYAAEGAEVWADVLHARSELERLPVLKSVIADDRQPKQTMLFNWAADAEVNRASFDSLGHSLGIYLPQDMVLSLLILQSSDSSARIKTNELEILASKDNFDYHPLSTDGHLRTEIVDGRETLVFDFPTNDFRYLKLRYLGSNRSPRFTNSFANLLQAYGRIVR